MFLLLDIIIYRVKIDALYQPMVKKLIDPRRITGPLRRVPLLSDIAGSR